MIAFAANEPTGLMEQLERSANGTRVCRALLAVAMIALAARSTVSAAPREEVLKPYDGPSVHGSDPSTLTGKVGKLLRGEIPVSNELPVDRQESKNQR